MEDGGIEDVVFATMYFHLTPFQASVAILYLLTAPPPLHPPITPSPPKKGRSSRSHIFFKIGALKNFAIFTGEHLYWSLLLIKLQRLQHRCYPVNIAQFSKTAFFIEHLQWLLLQRPFGVFRGYKIATLSRNWLISRFDIF